MFDKSLPPYLRLRRISANSLQDRVDEYCFLGPSVCQQEELSSAGMSEDREDTESTPLQSEGDIDEVEVDQPNPIKGPRRKKKTASWSHDIGDALEGKRIKKTVERLNFQRHSIPKRYKVENGRGLKLRDIPWINDDITKMNRSELKPLHTVLFGTPGKKASRRNDVRQFNGFTFEVDSEPYIRRRQKMLRSLQFTTLKVICNMLMIVTTEKVKPKLVDRILSFLNCPRIPETKATPDSSSNSKKATSTVPKKKPSKKNAVKKATPDGSSNGKKASNSKKATPDSSSNSKKASNGKKATPTPDGSSNLKKATGFFLPYTNGSHTLESSDDDAPLIKLKKKRLSNEQLIETVQKVLKEANLEEISMNQICQKVYDTYPDLDLTHRKDYIKETVKMIASGLLLVSAGNRQESVPVNTQESVPVKESAWRTRVENTPKSVPVIINNDGWFEVESVPVNTQESVPSLSPRVENTPKSVPVIINNDGWFEVESVPVNTQESVPVKASAWRTRVENTPKSVPVIMNNDGWFEVERDT